MAAIEVRPAQPDDARMLGVIGPAAYAESYAYLWDSPKAYCALLETFGPEAFAEQIADPGVLVWAAELNGSMAGFLTMKLGSADPINQRPKGAEIPRIYVLNLARGYGLGQRLLQSAIEAARERGLDYLWLDLMMSADWARRSYAAAGFQDIGRKQFQAGVKAHFAEMAVMSLDLS